MQKFFFSLPRYRFFRCASTWANLLVARIFQLKPNKQPRVANSDWSKLPQEVLSVKQDTASRAGGE